MLRGIRDFFFFKCSSCTTWYWRINESRHVAGRCTWCNVLYLAAKIDALRIELLAMPLYYDLWRNKQDAKL